MNINDLKERHGVGGLFPRTETHAVAGPETLSMQEEGALWKCEDKIRKGFESVWEMGEALEQVRDERLFRRDFRTFEDYCQQRWGFSATRAYQTIRGLGPRRNLLALRNETDGTDGTDGKDGGEPTPIWVPETESQARPLVGVPEETQREVARELGGSKRNGKVTAKDVKEAVEKRKPRVVEVDIERILSGDIHEAYSAAKLSCEIGGDKPWPTISAPFRHDGMLWTVTVICHSQRERTADGYPLIHELEYDGPERKPFSYEGWRVKTPKNGVRYRLGPMVLFRGYEAKLPKTNGALVEALAEAVVAIRRAQDLVPAADLVSNDHCNSAVKSIECVEQRMLKPHGCDGREERGEGKNGTNGANGTDGRKELFVICREPHANAIDGPNSKPRYKGLAGGWTPDPTKVTAFESVKEAKLVCKCTDQVVALKKAVRRFSSGLVKKLSRTK